MMRLCYDFSVPFLKVWMQKVPKILKQQTNGGNL